MQEDKCCVVSCDNPIDQNYWNQQYTAHTTGWDLGEVSPAIKDYLDALPSKNLSILIPGCGNAYEAAYLLSQGFTNVTVIDIAPLLVNQLKERFADVKNIKIINGDFFEHNGQYDLILEQTFFCALPPFLREHYVFQMHRLLKPKGILAGLLFNREFEDGPPFGGSKLEYEQLFKKAFYFKQFAESSKSVKKRTGMELFIELQKKAAVSAQLYDIGGITCGNCSQTITQKILMLDGVLNCSISTDFKQLLLISPEAILIRTLQDLLSYDPNYKITLFESRSHEQ